MKDNRVLPQPITQNQRVYYAVFEGGDDDHKSYPACIEKSARAAILSLPSTKASRLIDYFFTYPVDTSNAERIKGMLDSGRYDLSMESLATTVRDLVRLLRWPYFRHILENGKPISEDELDEESNSGYLPLSRKSINTWHRAGYRTAKSILRFLDNEDLWDESKKVQMPRGIGRLTLWADKQVIDRWRRETAKRK